MHTGEDLSCKYFHKRTFSLPSIDGTDHKIIRNNKKQIEIVSFKGLQSEYDIKWIDECTYILYNRRVTKGVNEYPDFKDTLYNQITPLSKNKCKVTSWFKESEKQDAVLTMIK